MVIQCVRARVKPTVPARSRTTRPNRADDSASPEPGVTPSSPPEPGVTTRPSPEPGVIPSPPRMHRRRRPTRRTALTLDAIVAAAIETLDEAGVAGLTMRRVAEQLGTGAASLYAHVSGRDELLELVFDELVGQVPLPEPDPDHWREQLRQMLLDLYQTLNAHSDAALAGMGRVATSPQGAGRDRADDATDEPRRADRPRDRLRDRSARAVRLRDRVRGRDPGAQRDEPPRTRRATGPICTCSSTTCRRTGSRRWHGSVRI